MSLRESFRAQCIREVFGIDDPDNQDFWDIWAQLIAIEKGWA